MRRVRSVSALRLGSPSPGRAGYGPYGVRTPVRRPASLSGPAHTLLSLGLLSPANRTPAPSARLCTGVIAPPEGPATAGPAAGRRPRCWTPVLGTRAKRVATKSAEAAAECLAVLLRARVCCLARLRTGMELIGGSNL